MNIINTIVLKLKPLLEKFKPIVEKLKPVVEKIEMVFEKLNPLFQKIEPFLDKLKIKLIFEKISVQFNFLVEAFLKFRIRTKLSIIIGAVIIVVVTALSTIILNNQRKETRKNVETVCFLTTQNLSNVSRDNLLLEATVPIQEAVTNVKKMNIPGLEYAYIADRNAKIVAHTEFSELNKDMPSEFWEKIKQRTFPQIEESEEHFQYIFPITVTKKVGGEISEILIGAAFISFSKAVINEPIVRTQRIILLTAFIITALSIYIVFLLSGQMVKVVLALSEGAKKVGSGDFSVRVMVRLKDEIGILASEFNNMVVLVRERIEMAKLVSTSAVEALRSSGTMARGGERKTVTLFFSDIRGFTSMSEKLEPEQVVEIINLYLDLQSRIIKKHNGDIDKFVGDEVMAIFKGDNMVDNAVSAALEIQQEIMKINKMREHEGKIAKAVGIGLNVGPAVIGAMGAHDRMDYTAIGDTVNLAARLCSAAEAYQVIAPKHLIEQLRGDYAIQEKEAIKVKGKTEPIPIMAIYPYNQLPSGEMVA
jgi:class 3 adenylate cyclase